MVRPEIPRIFIPSEGSRTLIDVLHEQYDNYDIYWYHWPYDGPFSVGDYEPIILTYRNKTNLCLLSTRRSWDYQPYTLDQLETPVELVFDGTLWGIFHHPFFHLSGFDDDFNNKRQGKIERTYNLDPINPDQIPIMFRTGQGHPTGFGRIVMDPRDKAEELYHEFCT